MFFFCWTDFDEILKVLTDIQSLNVKIEMHTYEHSFTENTKIPIFLLLDIQSSVNKKQLKIAG
jgi:hypothetical protein